jgi:hypothetical protein
VFILPSFPFFLAAHVPIAVPSTVVGRIGARLIKARGQLHEVATKKLGHMAQPYKLKLGAILIEPFPVIGGALLD